MTSPKINDNQPQPPSAEVLKAFGIAAQPQWLPGGEGTSFVAGEVVLKPVTNDKEVQWRAELLSQIKQDGFRVASHLTTTAGEWTADGWQAVLFIEGAEVKGQASEKIAISRRFHKALETFPKPTFIDEATHPWAVADRMVWDEQPLEYGQVLQPSMSRLAALLQPLQLSNQLIHGDMTGNILFHESLPPAVIDFSPYWRPAEFATAVIIVDSIVWEGGADELIDELPNTPEMNQLLVRAAMWRIKTTEEFIRQFGKGNIDDVQAYVHLIELIWKRLK